MAIYTYAHYSFSNIGITGIYFQIQRNDVFVKLKRITAIQPHKSLAKYHAHNRAQKCSPTHETFHIYPSSNSHLYRTNPGESQVASSPESRPNHRSRENPAEKSVPSTFLPAEPHHNLLKRHHAFQGIQLAESTPHLNRNRNIACELYPCRNLETDGS